MSIMALLGGALLAGRPGLAILKWAGKAWPLFLIGLGLYLSVRRQRIGTEASSENGGEELRLE